MTNQSDEPADHSDVDPGRPEPRNSFDKPTGLSGQAYSRESEADEGRERPSGHPLVGDTTRVDPPNSDGSGRDIPPENGRRASVDPLTGEVHGSGSGPGEDFDIATSGGAAKQGSGLDEFGR